MFGKERRSQADLEREALKAMPIGFPQARLVRLPNERQKLVLTDTEIILVQAVAIGVDFKTSKLVLDQSLGKTLGPRTYETHRYNAMKANGVATMWRLRMLAGEEGIVKKRLETKREVSQHTQVDNTDFHRTVKVKGDGYYFTRAHLRVMALALLGLTQEQIAQRLNTPQRSVTVDTIQTQFRQMRTNNAKKLSTDDRDHSAIIELALESLKRGWLNNWFIKDLYDRNGAARLAKQFPTKK